MKIYMGIEKNNNVNNIAWIWNGKIKILSVFQCNIFIPCIPEIVFMLLRGVCVCSFSTFYWKLWRNNTTLMLRLKQAYNPDNHEHHSLNQSLLIWHLMCFTSIEIVMKNGNGQLTLTTFPCFMHKIM